MRLKLVKQGRKKFKGKPLNGDWLPNGQTRKSRTNYSLVEPLQTMLREGQKAPTHNRSFSQDDSLYTGW